MVRTRTRGCTSWYCRLSGYCLGAPATVFDLTPTDEQHLMQDTLRRFAADVIRPCAGENEAQCLAPDSFHEQVTALGLGFLQIPESQGGGGATRSPIAGVLNAEALAHGDMGLALGALAPASCIAALLEWGTAEQQSDLLEHIAITPASATLAHAELSTTFEPSAPTTSAEPDGDSYRLNGVKCMVPIGLRAELLLVTCTLNGEATAFVVPADAEGLERNADPTMGVRAAEIARVTLTDVRVAASARLGEGPLDLAQMLALSRTALSALATGQSQAVLDYIIPYCNEREAFGEPISHRQAVAFTIADIGTEIEAMRLLSWRAASLAEQQLDFDREAYQAFLFACEHGMQVGTEGVQMLGGHGFTREHPVELWYRNLRALPMLIGNLIV